MKGRNYGWAPGPGYDESVPMTDLSRFPNAVEAIWSSGNPTIAPSGSDFLEGAQWGPWNGALAVAVLKNTELRIYRIAANGTLQGSRDAVGAEQPVRPPAHAGPGSGRRALHHDRRGPGADPASHAGLTGNPGPLETRRKGMRRLALALVVLSTLSACGDDGDGGGEAGGGEVETAPVEFGDGDDIWLQVETGGGFVPYLSSLRETPDLLLFDDGRLVREVQTDDLGGPVPEYEAVQLDEAATAELLDTFAAVVDGPDPGDPNVTDLPSTTIEVTTDGDYRELSIYALGFDDDDSLSDSEQAAREAASDAIDDAYAVEGAEPYVADELLVLTTALEVVVQGAEDDTDAASDPVAWPLDPERMASPAEDEVCTEVEGEDRDAVLDALGDAAFDALVTNGVDFAEVAVQPVLTGEESCGSSDLEGFVER